MKNLFTKASRIAQVSSLALALVLVVACGGAKHKRGDDSGSGDGQASSGNATNSSAQTTQPTSESEIKLKGASLIGSTLISALVPGVTISVITPGTDLVAQNAKQLGSNEGLAYGQAAATQVSETNAATGYMLALQIIAQNAAQVFQMKGNTGNCACGDKASAQGMLSRAIPYVDFNVADNQGLVTRLADLCSKDPVAGVALVFSTLAFAKKN